MLNTADGKEVQVCKWRGGYGNVAEKAKSGFASPTGANARGEAQDCGLPPHQANLAKRSAAAQLVPPLLRLRNCRSATYAQAELAQGYLV